MIGDALGDLAANLDGGGGDDRFLFEAAVVLTGTIDGQGGIDTLDFRGFGTAVDLALTASDAGGYAGAEPTAFSVGGFRGIDALIGPPPGVGPATVSGEDTTSVWSVGQTSTYEDVSGRPLTFAGFDSIDGGTGDDTYRLGPPAGTALSLSDAGGVDTLDFAPAPFGIAIDADSAAVQTIGPGRTVTLAGRFENVIGSPFPDAITIGVFDLPRIVEGGLPGTSPGDVLTFDAGGRPVFLTSTQILALGQAALTYSGIETVLVKNDSGVTRPPESVTLRLAAGPVPSRRGTASR